VSAVTASVKQSGSVDSELMDLHRLYVANRDPRLAEQLLHRYRGIAYTLAHRMSKRAADKDDVEQTALFALFKALQRFDPDREVSFSTFAWRTVEGEVKRYFRDTTNVVHVPRPLQERAAYVEHGVDELTSRIGRTPSIAEIAQHLLLLEDEVVEAMEAMHARRPGTIEHHDDGTDEDLRGTTLSVLEPAFETSDVRGALAAGLKHLPERQRIVVYLRFYCELSQTEIGERLGISQMHVSRLLTRALAMLRQSRHLQDD
jgi:RNA polymerase sigma-B factor